MFPGVVFELGIVRAGESQDPGCAKIAGLLEAGEGIVIKIQEVVGLYAALLDQRRRWQHRARPRRCILRLILASNAGVYIA